jgi:hypothetical protein
MQNNKNRTAIVVHIYTSQMPRAVNNFKMQRKYNTFFILV